MFRCSSRSTFSSLSSSSCRTPFVQKFAQFPSIYNTYSHICQNNVIQSNSLISLLYHRHPRKFSSLTSPTPPSTPSPPSNPIGQDASNSSSSPLPTAIHPAPSSSPSSPLLPSPSSSSSSSDSTSHSSFLFDNFFLLSILIQTFVAFVVFREFFYDFLNAVGPSMIPTLKASGEIVLIDHFSIRVYPILLRHYETVWNVINKLRGNPGKYDTEWTTSTWFNDIRSTFIYNADTDLPILKSYFGVERGDIVVGPSKINPGIKVSKRVVGLPGDWIRVERRDAPDEEGGKWIWSGISKRGGGLVTPNQKDFGGKSHWGLNGLSTQYNHDETVGYANPLLLPSTASPTFSPPSHPKYRWIPVPIGHIFLLGDNPSNSSDSRSYGPVHVSMVEGKISRVVWPLSEKFRKPLKTLQYATYQPYIPNLNLNCAYWEGLDEFKREVDNRRIVNDFIQLPYKVKDGELPRYKVRYTIQQPIPVARPVLPSTAGSPASLGSFDYDNFIDSGGECQLMIDYQPTSSKIVYPMTIQQEEKNKQIQQEFGRQYVTQDDVDYQQELEESRQIESKAVLIERPRATKDKKVLIEYQGKDEPIQIEIHKVSLRRKKQD